MELIENRNAQFMLLASFIIAVGLVITTVILNSIIFEINTAVGAGCDPSKNEIVNQIQITKNEMRSAYITMNSYEMPLATTIAYFNGEMNTFNGNLSKINALRGEMVNVSWDLRNWNGYSYANFTENGTYNGANNWTIIYGINASSVDVFRFWNATIFPGKSLKIEARNSTGYTLWSVELNSTSYVVTNTTKSSNGTFNPDAGDDFTLAKYYFNQSVSSDRVSINIINGSNAYGRFLVHGTANNRTFYRGRDYILNSTLTYSTNRVHANLTIPVSVPW